jgi:predicted PurR-regulated permease PerM
MTEQTGKEPAQEATGIEDLQVPPGPALVVVPRWVQLVTLPLAILALWALARAAGTVLLVFGAAAIIALILNPGVAALQRRRLPRGLAIPVIYLGVFGVLIGVGVMLANPISDQVSRFQRDVPGLIASANQRLADVQSSFDDKGIHIEIKRQGETALQTLQEKVIGGTGDVVSFGGDLLKRVVAASLGLILIFVLSVYMLVYGERIGAQVRAVMPPGDGTPEDDYPTRVQAAVAGYVRGQVLFSVAMGCGAGLGLYVFGLLGIFPDGRTYAFAFGVFFGLMELVPFVGPILGALPPVLVALFQDPLTAVWVALLFTALQQLEGHLVAPQIFGHALRINPLLVIFALLFGGQVYGLVGALLSLPIAAVLRETVVYLRRHLILEPWGDASPVAVTSGTARSIHLTAATRCPSCGVAVGRSDEYCRACGARLAPAEVASRR